MAISSRDVHQLSGDDLEIVRKIESRIDEQLQRDGKIIHLDTFDIKYEDGRILPDRIWDAVIENYTNAGWNAYREGRIIKVLK